MKTLVKDILDQSEASLRSCLSSVPFLEIQNIVKEVELGPVKADLVVELRTPIGSQVVIVEAKRDGQPRFAREAINQLLRYRQELPNAYGVLAAPYVSEAAAELCKREGVGYLDLSGNCRLSFKGIYIERQGKTNKFSRRRDLRSLYSPKASRILRVLLNNPKRAWKLCELAQEAQVSLGLAANVKKLLANREWLLMKADGFSLQSPEELLIEWSQNYSFRRNEMIDYYSLKEPQEVEADLAEVCTKEQIPYALTGFSAAARLAPMVRYQRASAYVGQNPKAVASKLDLKPVDTGANVTLLLPYDDGIFYGSRDFNGVCLASPIQTYLDLLGFRGRGEEAANTLLEEVIKREW